MEKLRDYDVIAIIEVLLLIKEQYPEKEKELNMLLNAFLSGDFFTNKHDYKYKIAKCAKELGREHILKAMKKFENIDFFSLYPSLLVQAIIKNDFKTVKELVKNGFDLHAKNPLDLNTPLMVAALEHDGQIFRYLLPLVSKESLEFKNDNGYTVLMHLIIKSCVFSNKQAKEVYYKAKLLIQHGADVNAKNLNNESLFSFMVSEHTNLNYHLCKLFVKHGVDVNYRNKKGETPLMYAVNFSEQVIKNILIKKAKSICKLLKLAGADVNAVNNHGETILHIVCKACFKIDYQDLSIFIPLNQISERGRRESEDFAKFVVFLIEKIGVNPKIGNFFRLAVRIVNNRIKKMILQALEKQFI